MKAWCFMNVKQLKAILEKLDENHRILIAIKDDVNDYSYHDVDENIDNSEPVILFANGFVSG